MPLGNTGQGVSQPVNPAAMSRDARDAFRAISAVRGLGIVKKNSRPPGCPRRFFWARLASWPSWTALRRSALALPAKGRRQTSRPEDATCLPGCFNGPLPAQGPPAVLAGTVPRRRPKTRPVMQRACVRRERRALRGLRLVLHKRPVPGVAHPARLPEALPRAVLGGLRGALQMPSGGRPRARRAVPFPAWRGRGVLRPVQCLAG